MDNNFKFYFRKGMRGGEAIKDFLSAFRIILKLILKSDIDVYVEFNLQYMTDSDDAGFDLLELLDENLEITSSYLSNVGNRVNQLQSSDATAWIEQIPVFPLPDLPEYKLTDGEDDYEDEEEYTTEELQAIIAEQSEQLKQLTASNRKVQSRGLIRRVAGFLI